MTLPPPESQAAAPRANPESEPVLIARQSEREETQVYRAGAYRLLAALLRSPPDAVVLDQVANLAGVDTETDELSATLSALGQAVRDSSAGAIDEEFHTLFIGLGRGELMPYGSWYLTGFLMEKPLGVLRDDLVRLGYERNDGIREPEDHIAALCEVMSMLIAETLDQPSQEGVEGLQEQFFQAHIGTWVDRFFQDLSETQSAVFYRSVGRFGLAFAQFEQRYFSMNA